MFDLARLEVQNGLLEVNTVGLPLGPHEILVKDQEDGPEREAGADFQTHQFTLIMSGIGSPSHEHDEIVGHLGHGSRSSIFKLDLTILQWRGHRDGASGHVGVVVQTGSQFDTRGGLTISVEKREHVLGTVMLTGRIEGQIRGQRTAVRVAGRFLVGVRVRERIRQNARSLKHFTFIVGTIRDIIGGGDLLNAAFRQDLIDKMTEMNLLHGMARGADLTVDLIATASSRNVVGVTIRLEVEGIFGKMGRIFVSAGYEATTANDTGDPAEHRANEAPRLLHDCVTN